MWEVAPQKFLELGHQQVQPPEPASVILAPKTQEIHHFMRLTM